LLHGNSDFKVPERGSKDTTELARHLIKFPCNTVSKVPNSNLFALLEKNKLQFIHWPLTCDLPCDFFLGRVPSLNEFMDQYVEDEMRAFVLDRVYIDPKAVTPLGAVEPPKANSLYKAYIQFCLERDYEICSWSKFSSQFLVTLRSLRVEATKTRRKDGQHIKGVTLKEGTPVCPPDNTFADELRGRDPFDISSRKEETSPSPPLIGKGVQTEILQKKPQQLCVVGVEGHEKIQTRLNPILRRLPSLPQGKWEGFGGRNKSLQRQRR
jgi:hypothetical protein